jgi:hypothetical protein
LCDANWQFIAISPAMSAHFGAGDLVGRSAMTIPRYRRYAEMLVALPLFNGDLRVVQFCSESWRDGQTHTRDMAFWPVLTSEDELMVHVVANPRTARPTPEFQGLRITEVRIVMLDGSVLGADNNIVAR